MLKFLIIVGLILYCVYKIGSLFFRAGVASQRDRRPNDIPNPRKAKKPEFKGGEYIDYEEIK